MVIATPDHWHAPIATAALEAGKHAYEENTGARGLVSAVERALLIFEKKLPSTDIKRKS